MDRRPTIDRTETDRGCTAKMAYPTMNKARNAASKVAIRNGDGKPMNAYKCKRCRQYHIGHKPYWA